MHLARVSRNNALYILYVVDRRRIELLLHACKAHVLPLSLTAQKKHNMDALLRADWDYAFHVIGIEVP